MLVYLEMNRRRLPFASKSLPKGPLIIDCMGQELGGGKL